VALLVSPTMGKKTRKERSQKKVMKAMKKKSHKSVQYTRHDNKPQKSRGDRVKWTRNLEELLQANDQQIVRMLSKDKLTKNWTSKPCPHCFEGTCGLLKMVGKRGLVYRCDRDKCQKFVYPTMNHPFFTSGRNHLPLQKQAAVLLMLLAKVSLTSIHKVLGYNHKVMEHMYQKLCQARKMHVEKIEKKIQFGGKPYAWSDVEADEATFGHTDADDDENPKAKVRHWEQ
jgi:gas vesicle protein